MLFSGDGACNTRAAISPSAKVMNPMIIQTRIQCFRLLVVGMGTQSMVTRYEAKGGAGFAPGPSNQRSAISRVLRGIRDIEVL